MAEKLGCTTVKKANENLKIMFAGAARILSALVVVLPNPFRGIGARRNFAG